MGHTRSNMAYLQTNKMERLHHYFYQVIDLLLKGWIYVCMVIVSIGVQLGYYLFSGKKESFMQLIGRFLISACLGAIIVIFCVFRWPPVKDTIPLQAVIIIPIGILMSDKIVKFFATVGLKEFIRILRGIDYNAIVEIVFGEKKE